MKKLIFSLGKNVMNFSKKAKGTVSSSLVISVVSAPYALQAKALNFEEIKGSFLNFFARTFYYWWYRKSFINRVNRLLENKERLKVAILNKKINGLKSSKNFNLRFFHNVLQRFKKVGIIREDFKFEENNLVNEKENFENFISCLNKSAEEAREELQRTKPVFDYGRACLLLEHFSYILEKDINRDVSDFTYNWVLTQIDHVVDLLKDDKEALDVYIGLKQKETCPDKGLALKLKKTRLELIINSLRMKVLTLSNDVCAALNMEKFSSKEAIVDEVNKWMKKNKRKYFDKYWILRQGNYNGYIKSLRRFFYKATEEEEKSKSLNYAALNTWYKNLCEDLPAYKSRLEEDLFYFSSVKEDVTAFGKYYLEPLEKLLLEQAE